MGGRPLQTQVETSMPSRPSTSQRPRRNSGGARPASSRSVSRATTSMARPQSQQSTRIRSVSQLRQRPSTSKEARRKEEIVAVHKGRPIDFSRALAGAYMGAARKENVKK